MRRRLIRSVVCPCGQAFATGDPDSRWCSKRCASRARALANNEQRAEQLRKARDARKPRLPKPDLSVFDVPVFLAPAVVEELDAELPPIPCGIDHASLVMLRWTGARV